MYGIIRLITLTQPVMMWIAPPEKVGVEDELILKSKFLTQTRCAKEIQPVLHRILH